MRRAFLILAFAACGGRPPAHPNVLLVTFDTLRPDAVGLGTPAINAFLKEATLYRGARTVTPLTLPSHLSMFTGLGPVAHGVHDNITEPIPPRDRRTFPLLAEQFRDKGYATAAFVARAVLSAATGIDAGFDHYDGPRLEGEWEEAGGYVPGEERVRAPVAWIEGAAPGKPWFVWVHFFDPHAPYNPFAGDPLRPATRATDPADVRYGGEVRRADAAFERLMREVGPGTVVVIASDHGEALFEHGEATHGPLCYGATIRALLAVRGPGFKRGAEDSKLRSVSDIAPTLRRLCGLPAVEGEGRDLAGPPHEILVAESLFTWWAHGWGQVFSVTDGSFSLVESGSALELFDLGRDPGETSPLPLSHPAYEKLDRALERFRVRKWAAGDGGDLLGSVLPYGALRRIETGYLSRHENAKLLNPKDLLRDWDVIEAVPTLIHLCSARKEVAPLREMLRTLEGIEKRSPRSPRIDHHRAKIYGAIAHMTGAPAKFADAAWAEISAIEKGYVQKETIAPAIAYSLASSNADALRTLVRLLNRSEKRLDAETAKSLAEARKTLGVEEDVIDSVQVR